MKKRSLLEVQDVVFDRRRHVQPVDVVCQLAVEALVDRHTTNLLQAPRLSVKLRYQVHQMLRRLRGHLHDEQVVKAFETTVEHVVAHGVVEKIDDFGVVAIGMREDELLPGDQHDVVEENEVSGIVAERVSHVITI